MNRSLHNDLLSGLNPNQRQAASFKDGAMLVLAGPGSGKTHVITKRIQYLIEKCNVKADRILVITFTKAAAKEMQERSIRLCSASSQTVFGTFHSVFYFILNHSFRFKQFNLMTDRQKYQIMNRIIANRKSHSTTAEKMDLQKSVASIQSEFEKWLGFQKNNGNCFFDGNHFCLEVHENDSADDNSFLEEIFLAYETECLQEQLMDYDDILLFCKFLLEEIMVEKKKWQNRFDYILIDEFQDINEVQYQILKLLSEEKNNIFAVGDDDQAIYSFRGSKPEYMKQFLEDYNAKECILNLNYRCDEPIVKMSSAFINQNQNRICKQLRSAYNNTNDEESNQVQLLRCESDKLQYVFVHQLITKHLDNSETVVILLRTNYQVEKWKRELNYTHENQASSNKNVTMFLEKDYVKDVLAVLRFVHNGFKRVDFLRFMNKPERLILRENIDSVVSFDKMLGKMNKDSEIYTNILKLKKDLDFVRILDPYGAICYVLFCMGYQDYIMKSFSLNQKKFAQYWGIASEKEIIQDFDNLKELSKRYCQMKDFLEWINLEEERIKLFREEIETKKDVKIYSEKVSIMTYHGSKGLEFDCVIMPEIDRGVVPHGRYLESNELEEERRMFYVAMTRAKSALYILYHRDKTTKEEELSVFLRELKQIKNSIGNDNISYGVPNAYSPSINSSNSELSKYSSNASDAISYSSSSSMKRSSGSSFGSASFSEYP